VPHAALPCVCASNMHRVATTRSMAKTRSSTVTTNSIGVASSFNSLTSASVARSAGPPGRRRRRRHPPAQGAYIRIERARVHAPGTG